MSLLILCHLWAICQLCYVNLGTVIMYVMAKLEVDENEMLRCLILSKICAHCFRNGKVCDINNHKKNNINNGKMRSFACEWDWTLWFWSKLLVRCLKIKFRNDLNRYQSTSIILKIDILREFFPVEFCMKILNFSLNILFFFDFYWFLWIRKIVLCW